MTVMKRLVVLLCLAMAAICSQAAAQQKKLTISPPVIFEPNRGQTAGKYEFLSRQGGMVTLYRAEGLDVIVPESRAKLSEVHLRWANANPRAAIEGQEALPGRSNYIRDSDPSRWVRNVPQFTRVRYKGIYPGTDLVFHGSGDQLENDFVLEPGADPSKISLRLDLAWRITADGDLKIDAGKATIYLHRPVAYQKLPGGRKEVAAKFVRARNGAVQFALGGYDHTRELVIDPVFGFSTYLGGTGSDQITAVTTDSNANVYVTGFTTSTDFPVTIAGTANSPQAYIAKFDPTGHTLMFSTFFGGSGGAQPASIRIDGNGNILVSGTAGMNFTHFGAMSSPSCQINGSCYFVISLQPSGASLNYAGLVGGEAGIYHEGPVGVLAVDSGGNAYLAGTTDDSNFQLTSGTLGTSVPGYPYDSTFVLKLDPSGHLVYSTSILGTAPADPTQAFQNAFYPNGIFVDANGQATIAGLAGVGLPTTSGALQRTFPNPMNENASAGFILQLNSTASSLNYATYVPGTDTIGGLAVDTQGNSYVAGQTSETNLPVTNNAYQPTLLPGPYCTCDAGFIVKINGQGTSVLAATYLQGNPATANGATSLTAIGLDSHSNVFVGGATSSANFPLQNPFVSQNEGSAVSIYGLVIAGLNPDLSSLVFGSFLSSTTAPEAGSAFTGLAIDAQDNLIVAGQTESRSFPTTQNSYEPVLPPQASPGLIPGHGFISKLDMNTPAPSVCFASWSLNFGNVPANTSVTQPLNLTNCGNAPLHIASLVSSNAAITASQSCGAVAPGGVCPIQLTFSPPSSSAVSATLSINDDAVISPQIVGAFGQGVGPRLSPESTSISFGSLLVGTTGVAVPLFIDNTGNAALRITSISITGDFALTVDSCSSTTIQAQKFCAVEMTFSPTAAGSRSGTLAINSNDPQFPQTSINLSGTGLTSYLAPSISALGSPTAPTGTSPLTVQITGTNFVPASVVKVNGAPQPTTFLSNTSVTASVSPSPLGAFGEVPVTVFNPAPGGGESAPVTLTLYSVVPIYPRSLAYVPTTKLLYASIPNAVVPIDPSTGIPGAQIPVCNDPRALAASDDGKYLYVSCNGDRAIQRLNLQTSAVERTFPFPANQTAVADMHTMPGSSQLVVAAFDSVVALYNDAGFVNLVPTPAPNTNQILSLTSFAFVGNDIYALPFTDVQNPFFILMTVGSQGLQYTPVTGTNFGSNSQTGALVVSDGTLLYTNAGQVWNPATQTQTGTFPVVTYNKTSYPNMWNTVVDNTLGQIYVIGDQNYGESSSAAVLSAYGKQSLTLTGSLAFPQLFDTDINNLQRWGTNGFAFIADAPNSNVQELYLLRSSIASPQTANAIPVLSTISPAAITAGGPAFTLTLNGSGFAPNAMVYWNGAPRETTTVSGSVVMALISASDISVAGTAQVTVVNPPPGGGTSSALTMNIGGSGQASLSTTALNFAATAVGTSTAAQTVTVTNSGSSPLSFSSISASGDFSQTNTCATLSASSACTISVIFTPTAAGTRTGTLTITDSDPLGQQTVLLTGMGNDIQIGGSGSSGTTATVSAGQPASYTLSISPMGGFSGQVTFSCSNLPPNASCNINPATTTLSNGPVSVTVSISTSQQAGLVGRRDYRWPSANWYVATLLLCFGGIWACFWSQKTRRFALLAILIGVAAAGCGGGGNSGSAGSNNTAAAVTPSGTYMVNFTASASGISRTIQLKLVVQ